MSWWITQSFLPLGSSGQKDDTKEMWRIAPVCSQSSFARYMKKQERSSEAKPAGPRATPTL